ncbi:cysteine-rich protein 2-binding protein [Periplaneta americana]|uniref:cysteine-rich protein 2-binding protein n=1 Tax=Periplaneta americana TaxID=6978 RepID=UPI0037E90739
MMDECAYCSRKTNEDSEFCLLCEECNKRVHVRCLKRGGVPGGLHGDVFYKFVCQNCSTWDREEFTREKMPWINLIILALYNLHHRSDGVSRHGYFHWKMHICNFIEQHWNILFGSSVRKKRSWMGTVSGTLSHYSPTYFRSGSEELRESGWWKLALNIAPKLLMQQHAQMSGEKKKKVGAISQLKLQDFPRASTSVSEPGSGASSQESSPCTARISQCMPPDESSLSAYDDTSSVELNNAESERETGTSCSSGRVSAVDTNPSYYNNWASFKASENMYSRAYVEPSETLSDCLFADEDEECSDVDVDIEGVDISCPPSQGFQDLGDLLPQQESGTANCNPESNVNVKDSLRLEPESLKTEIKEEPPDTTESGVEEDASDEDVEPPSTHKPAQLPPPLKSLFTITKSKVDIPPLRDNYDDADSRCLSMSEYEELQLLNQLRRVPTMTDVPGAVRRLYRKLCVRRLKRERGIAPFNLDKRPGQKGNGVTHPFNQLAGDVRILDRFQKVPVTAAYEESGNPSFIVRLMGQSEPSCFYSPYTGRLLKPYIRRDMETEPLWLRLLNEVQAKANKNNPQWHLPPRYPIDYSYVRPQHISSVNSLCREFFYPGIDLTECLQYPDFSCVVLYKKLVVGFAFMVPDVGLNEAYISFLFTRPEWRRAGIATFMLYHLIQTCMGKDLTLHVSATNSALVLYQKFGFKVEEFVQDFYDKYFPADSKECKHALFLRLSR